MSKSDKAPTCYCPAYKFPHRFMSGDCTGWSAVEVVWDKWSGCFDCAYIDHTQDGPHEPGGSFCRLLEHRKGQLPGACPGLGEIVKEKK